MRSSSSVSSQVSSTGRRTLVALVAVGLLATPASATPGPGIPTAAAAAGATLSAALDPAATHSTWGAWGPDAGLLLTPAATSVTVRLPAGAAHGNDSEYVYQFSDDGEFDGTPAATTPVPAAAVGPDGITVELPQALREAAVDGDHVGLYLGSCAEGAACASAAQRLDVFLQFTWNSGADGAAVVELTPADASPLHPLATWPTGTPSYRETYDYSVDGETFGTPRWGDTLVVTAPAGLLTSGPGGDWTGLDPKLGLHWSHPGTGHEGVVVPAGPTVATDGSAFSFTLPGEAPDGWEDGAQVTAFAAVDDGTALAADDAAHRIAIRFSFGVTPPAALSPTITPPATLSPVSGTPQVGATLTVAGGVWAPEATSLTYQWLADDVAVSGATGTSLSVGPSLLGARIAVDVTGSLDGAQSVTVRTGATTRVLDVFAAAPVPTITGTARVGTTLRANPGTWSPTATLAYQWKAGTTVVGTASTYVPAAADLAKPLTVSVTATADGYGEVTRTSAATAAVVTGPFTAAPVPTIAGTVKVGTRVTAKPGTWAPTATLSYQWRRSGTPIPGATAASYLVTATDLGRKLTVAVTATRKGYTTKTAASAASVVAEGTFTARPTPTVSGTPRVGSTMTARAGTWAPTAVLSYQWRRNSAPIAGATRSSYVVTAADHAKKLTVTVTARRPGFTTATRTSAPSAPVIKPFTRTAVPVILGTAQLGSTLRASVPAWSPAATATTFQWKRAGVAIPGATSAAYRLTEADLGKTITVTATGTRSTYVTTARTSGATGPVTRAFIAAPTPVVSGNAWPGQVLTASSSAWNPTATLAYQWLRDGAAIPGATGSQYTLTAADAGHQIAVTVTGSRASYVTASRTSAPVTIGSCTVKGNKSSSGEWIYHVPGGQFYAVTIPEACFDTESQAVAAGYRKSKR